MYNPLSQDYRSNPLPTFRLLLEEGLVHWSDLLTAWIVTRYEDVAGVLADERFSSTAALDKLKAPGEAQSAYEQFLSTSLHYSDAPVHTRLRRLGNPVFSRHSVEWLRPGLQKVLDMQLLFA